MGNVAVSLGPLQVSVRWIGRMLVAPMRYAMGTPGLERGIRRIEHHVSAMTEILYVLIADASTRWSREQQERVLRQVANFTIVNEGLDHLRPSGNPFAVSEIDKLREYTKRAQEGGSFTPAEASEFRQLSEKAAREYPEQDWVTDLLKLALFAFGLYALSKPLNPGESS